MSEFGHVLERFYGVLLQQIRDNRPEYLTTPFTVAEIYQDLVPYRSFRDVIGLEMNGDYEDALFRMLSGEGDYLMLDSEVARQQMQNELTSPNPNTALFREFAAVDVRLHPSRVPLGASPGSEAPPGSGASEVPKADPVDLGATAEVSEVELGLEAPEELQEAAPERPSDVGADGPAETSADASEAESVEASRPESGGASEDGVVGHIETATTPPLASVEGSPPDESVSTVAERSDVLTVCAWCREDLPVRDSIHFCPFCGSDLLPAPCRECGEEMLARWLFCVSCGADKRG